MRSCFDFVLTRYLELPVAAHLMAARGTRNPLQPGFTQAAGDRAKGTESSRRTEEDPFSGQSAATGNGRW